VRKLSLIYALVSMLYTTIAIMVFLYIVKNPTITDLGLFLASPLGLFPIICTFFSGYVSFLLKIPSWLLGLVHFVFAHILVWVCYFLIFALFKYSEMYAVPQRIFKSLNESTDMIQFSLIGGVWIFPGFVLLGYFLKRKLLPSKI